MSFLLDGVVLGPEDTEPPYSQSWDATHLPGSQCDCDDVRDVDGNRRAAEGRGKSPRGSIDEAPGRGLTFPTAFEYLTDGRMLITEFYGRVLLVRPGENFVAANPVLILPNIFNEDVTAGGERGLVNVVADPAFASNGYIYLFYTAASPQRDRVSRFTMNGDVASPATEHVVWQGKESSSSTDHHGGGLAFGLDGMLYISTGDNGTLRVCSP